MNIPLEWRRVDDRIDPTCDSEATTLELNKDRYYIYLKIKKVAGQIKYRYILTVRAYSSFDTLNYISPVKFTKERAKAEAEIKARRLLRVLCE